MKKNNFIDFYHIPKLSIGFKRKKEQENTATYRLQEEEENVIKRMRIQGPGRKRRKKLLKPMYNFGK